MNDPTSDLTDEQLFVAADEGWRSLGSHGLRAVAALARQGWAPVGTGPSLEDLGPLIVWLGDAAIQAADVGRSDDAGMLTWASLVLGERVNEDAPDHIAGGSNMVASSALPGDVEQALIDAESALGDIAKGRASKVLTPLEWAEGRAFRALAQIRPVMHQLGVGTSEPPTVPPVVKESLTTAPAPPADAEVKELVKLLNAEASEDLVSNHLLWMSATEVRRVAELLQRRHPAPVVVSERPWEHQPGWLDPDGECWWCPPEGPPYWQMANPAMVYGGWVLPASALPLPAGEG